MSALVDLIRGKGAHIDPVKAVEDLPWEMAGRRVGHLPHTIWQQLGHLNYWIDFELKKIEGQHPKVPERAEMSWPAADGPADETGWALEVALLRTNLSQLATLGEAKASTLARIVDGRTGMTVESALWLLVAHNSYHVGQIVHLRQALGAWPAADGGLSW